MSDISTLKREGQPDLAYIYTPPGKGGENLPLVMFCGGYRSDMSGTKATYLEDQCKARGQAYVRFDYSGHGESEGAFEDGTIGAWFDDACAVFDHVAQGRSVLIVGSSMGGWIALLLARARPESICGVIGIAAAPDFTEVIFERLSADQQETLMRDGHVAVPNDYSDEPYHYSKAFYEEAKAHLLLTQPQTLNCPLHLIQGRRDIDVPPETAEKIDAHYAGGKVQITFIDDGDHRLSRPQDLEVIDQAVVCLNET